MKAEPESHRATSTNESLQIWKSFLSSTMMATFDSMSSSMTQSMTSIDPASKQPLKRLQPTIQRFTKIALPTDLERLTQHKKLIKRYKEQEDWKKVNTEQINARLTVQQLKANIREMDKARCQIREEDHEQLDALVNPLKQEALDAIAEFIQECGLEALPSEDQDISPGPKTDVNQIMPTDTEISEESEVLGGEVRNHQSQSQTNEENERLEANLEETKQIEESWNKLKGDLEDVNSIIKDFAQQVQQQKEVTDRIEDNVDQAHTSILQGTRNLVKTSKLKSVVLPVAGAVVGTAVGGPIGLMVGYKVGALAAFGGGALGFVSARILKKRSDTENDSELERLDEEETRLQNENSVSTNR